MSGKLRVGFFVALVSPSALIVGCNNEGTSGNGIVPGDFPGSISVPSAEVELGHHVGGLRRKAKVDGFSMSQRPVSEAEFAECVEAGACVADAEADKPRANRAQRIKSPDDASQFCAWVGGRLPTYPEWLLAARGKQVQRYSWGDSPPTCETAHVLRSPDGSYSECDPAEEYDLGSRPAASSPYGLEDVLLPGDGELVGPGGSAGFFSCRSNHCRVSGFDSYVPSIDIMRPAGVLEQGATFRCVSKGEK